MMDLDCPLVVMSVFACMLLPLALVRAITLVLGLCKLPGQFCRFAVSLLFGMVLQKLHVDFKSEP